MHVHTLSEICVRPQVYTPALASQARRYCMQDANSGTWSAQLWQRHNWHWYLKRQHCWPCCTFASALWSDTDASALHVVASIAEGAAWQLHSALPCGFTLNAKQARC